MFDFRIFFFLLYWYTCLLYVYVDNISHLGLSVCFWQIKRLVVFCLIKFCVKNEMKCAWTFEMLTVAFGESTISRIPVQLWYNRFKEGRDIFFFNDGAHPGLPSKSTTDENIKAVQIMSLDNRRITTIEVVLLMPSNFYGCCRHETCGSEDGCKTAKFWAKTTSRGQYSEDVDDVQWRCRFAQKCDNWWRIMGVRLWHWNQSLIIEWKRFATIEDIKDKSKQKLLAISKSAFQKCFEAWKKLWHKCIISEGGLIWRGQDISNIPLAFSSQQISIKNSENKYNFVHAINLALGSFSRAKFNCKFLTIGMVLEPQSLALQF